MTDVERLELECWRAYVAAGRWLGPAAFARYRSLVELEAREALVARVLSPQPKDPQP